MMMMMVVVVVVVVNIFPHACCFEFLHFVERQKLKKKSLPLTMFFGLLLLLLFFFFFFFCLAIAVARVSDLPRTHEVIEGDVRGHLNRH